MKNFTLRPFVFSSIFFAVLFKGLLSYSQVSGCTDPYANNYNAAATVNDGSCTYNTTTYTPPIKVDPISDSLKESSGVLWAGNSLWSFNDGGNPAAIYRIDTASRAVLQTVYLGGATNVDWEDMRFDGEFFYVGDFGNNANGARTDLKIYKFPLSAIPDYKITNEVTVPATLIQIINFTYEDQPQPPVPTTAANRTKYDCEAMIIEGGKIHLFSKNWVDNSSTHYVINSLLPGTYVATVIETLATNYVVTSADKVPGQSIVALLGYQASGFGNHYMHLLSDYTGDKYFNGNKRRLDLPNATQMGQAEGISFREGTYGYITNERFSVFTLTVNQKLRSFNIGGYVPVSATTLPISLAMVKAWQKNEGIEVAWTIEEQTNIKQFEIERSEDGRHFAKAAVVVAKNTSTYNWLDVNPNKNNNFYRIKVIDKSGNVKYSQEVNVKISNGKSVIDVYPNPVIDHNITVRFINQTIGQYMIELFNQAGQKVFKNVISHPGGSASQILRLNEGIMKGIYRMQVSNAQSKIVQNVLID